jgi:glycosyltransferase involved in cell wall biosynthesis
MPPVKATIVIPSYNSRATICKCLSSIYSSENRSLLEVIVVDSGEDDISELVRESFPQVILIRATQRLLPGAARNLGWQSANSKFVIFLDSDCIVSEQWFQDMYDSLMSGDNIVTGSFAISNPKDRWGFLVFCSELSGSLPGHKNKYSRLAPAGNSAFNISILKKYGGFVENSFCEDTILAHELNKDGYAIKFNPKALVYHINREGFRSFKYAFYRSGYYSGLARFRYKLKGHIFTRTPLLIPLLLPYRLYSVYITNLKGKNPQYFRLILNFPLLFIGLLIWTYTFYKGQLDAKRKL